MIKLFKKTETEKYIIIKILFIKITFKKKSPKSDIDAIVWWIPNKNAIIYNNNQDLYDKLIYSININSNEYKSLQQNLQKLSKSIYNQSINNLKNLINKL